MAGAQGRGNANWTTNGYDAQRSSWVRTDAKISTESLSKPGFQFLWKIGLAGQPTPMVVLDPYTGYRGHKSLGFLSGPADDIFGIDIDLGLVEWHVHRVIAMKPPANNTLACPGGMSSSLARPTAVAIPAVAAGSAGLVRSGSARGAVGEPYQGAANLLPPAAAPAPPRASAPAARAAPAVARPNAVYALTSDGMLQTLYVSNGAEAAPPLSFVPANAQAFGLIVVDNVAYVETAHGCGGVRDGIWALDLANGQVTSWRSGDAGIVGTAGPAFGPDGTLYVTTGDALTALEPRTLTVKSSFQGKFASSPVVFRLGDKILVAAATVEGDIQLLNAAAPDVSLYRTTGGPSVHLIPGALTSWQDPSGTRWILEAADNAITAWKVAEQNGTPGIGLAWTSRNIAAPLTPVVVNGVVFAAAGGNPSTPGVLYALDGVSGRELWNSGNTIASFVHSGELSAGDSQIYLSTYDGTLYAFGFPMEH